MRQRPVEWSRSIYSTIYQANGTQARLLTIVHRVLKTGTSSIDELSSSWDRGPSNESANGKNEIRKRAD